MRDRTGEVYQVISLTELIIDCSCWLCYEFGILHCRQPHGLNLKKGDWVLTTGGEIYNQKSLPGFGNYAYSWEVDVESVKRTSLEEEIKSLEETGETDCGWYQTLIHRQKTEIKQADHRQLGIGFPTVSGGLMARDFRYTPIPKKGLTQAPFLPASYKSCRELLKAKLNAPQGLSGQTGIELNTPLVVHDQRMKSEIAPMVRIENKSLSARAFT